jgi:hypothetical protein
MECPQDPIPIASPTAAGACFSGKGFLFVLLAALLIGLALAWAAHVVQGYFAPIVLFPLLLGIVAGMAIVGLVRLAQIGNRPTILLATLLGAGLAAAGEHYFTYLSAYYWPQPTAETTSAGGQDLTAVIRQIAPSFTEYMHAQATRGRPLLFGFVAHGWGTWLSWAVDGLLVVAAAMAVAISSMRVPYCDHCGSWYRTIRSGRIDAITARRLAALVGAEEIDHPRSQRYRLSACLGGCGPTRLELSWEEADGAVDLIRLWLDPTLLNQATAILDELAEENREATIEET